MSKYKIQNLSGRRDHIRETARKAAEIYGVDHRSETEEKIKFLLDVARESGILCGSEAWRVTYPGGETACIGNGDMGVFLLPNAIDLTEEDAENCLTDAIGYHRDLCAAYYGFGEPDMTVDKYIKECNTEAKKENA